ncbi:hypothetical protein DFR58_12221 [Anaerobacterium chartisolvens]|uniref:CAAX prenyl protease 2/Lysostaphin resistance protein A-like domain-containing protein n=1 Tax=Anaerobacterium chartisolvens TaxID=1297424 RepID=A0A369ASJ4_9FIRM|nr:type II CAAX endopeptidase family protein [Anaerobacterium chartisolvens]RCX12332.1 hypothetical protein DFR58_12221 [Anaerobacterium chartisolvens]
MKYLKMSAFILLYLGVYFILQSYLGGMAGLFYSIKAIIQNPLNINPNEILEPVLKNTVFILILASAASFFIYWGAFKLRKENFFAFCGFSGISKKNIFYSLLLGLSLVLPVNFFVSLLSIDKLSPDVQNMFKIIFEDNSAFMLLLGIGIAGPVIEEIIFRGLILKELSKNMSAVPAVIIQALLFGIYHLNLTQAIYASVLGIILGVVCLWTRSIWSAILIHVFYNSSSVILSKVPGLEAYSLGHALPIVASSVIALAALSTVFINRRNPITPNS